MLGLFHVGTSSTSSAPDLIARPRTPLSPVPGLGTDSRILRVLKGEDIVVLLKLSLADETWTVRSLADETGIPRSGVHRALKRLAAASLFNERRRRVSVGNAEEFLLTP